MGKSSLLIVFCFIAFLGAHCRTTTVTNLIKEFLMMQKEPTIVSAYLCWNEDEEHMLLKVLYKENNVLVNIRNIVGNNIVLDGSAPQQVFLLDLNCDGYINILNQANEKKLFQQPYRWLILKNNTVDIPSYLHIFVDSKFYIAEQLSNSAYQISAVYKITKSFSNFLSNDIGFWNQHVGFEYYNYLSAARNRTGLMGITMNISYVVTDLDTLNHLWDYRDKHIDGITKLNYIFSHHVTDMMNASRRFIMQRTWGYKNQTTNIFSGMIGDLQTEIAELGGTPSFFTKDRIPVIDFIAPTTPTRAKFIFRAPPLSYVTNVFTLPFDKMVWYASFLLIGFISIVVYTIVQWEWRDSEFRKVLQARQNVLKPKFIDVLLMELGAICQQGAEAEPKSAAGRTATIFVFLALMFMYTSYSANIVALLQSTSDSIKTLDDLLKSRIKLGVEEKPYSHYYFETETEPIRKAIYEQKIAPKGQPNKFMDIEIGIEKMRDDFFAFHVECSSGYKVVGDIFQESEKCGLSEIEYLQVIDPWMAIQKNSTYKELAKVAFRKLHESGIQNREFRRLYIKKPACQSRGSNFKSVGLIDCYYAFLVFGVAATFSVILFILELIIKRKTASLFGKTDE